MGQEATQPERGDNWDGVLRRSIDVAIRVIDSETRAVEVVASDETLDSHGDVLKQHWNLGRYANNPVVLWNHNIFESSPYSFGGSVRPEDTFPIGRGENVRVEDGQLKAKLILGSAEYSAIAEKVFLGCKEKIIRAVSVGFRPGNVNRITKADGSTDHYELGSAEHPNELREISFVPMGSNPNAIAKSIAFERKQLDLLVQPRAGAAQEIAPMATTQEEKAALEKALADAKAATELATQAEARASMLKDELATTQAALKAATEAREKADAARAKTALDGLQGVKFAPAERERLEKHVRALGLDEVLEDLAARQDLAVTQKVLVGGQETRGAHQPTPAPAEGGDAGADIVAAAEKAAAAA